jgi:predicted ATPase
MQLTRIKIENLRAIKSLDIDLSEVGGGPRRQVVFIGANGSGKTTILDAIAHVYESVGADDLEELGTPGLSSGDVRGSDASSEADDTPRPRGRLTVEGTLSSAEHHAARRHVAEAPGYGSLEFYLGGAWDAIGGVPTGTFRDAARAALLEAQPPCVLLPADRGALEPGNEVTFKEVSKLDRRQGCLSKKRQRFAPLGARLVMAFLVPKQADPGGAVARMWKVLEKYFPELPRPVDVKDGDLWFETAEGAHVPLSALSEGERALLLLFGEIALRSPKDGLVMIDEVEQHLHPRWQRVVLAAIAALVPTAQIIVTTQSPYLAASAPDDRFKLGDWDRDGE